MIVLNSPHNPIGKVFSKEELQAIGDLCVKNNIIILSDEVYDRLFYVPFTRVATLSPEIARLTLTVGSGGKNFYATGWRVGWLIGPEHLIKYVSAAHTRICYSSVSPLQEATAIGFEEADKHNFWEESKKEMKGKMDKFNKIWDELGLPVSFPLILAYPSTNSHNSTPTPKAATSSSSIWQRYSYRPTIISHPT
jgi:kynurenine aminotransferase